MSQLSCVTLSKAPYFSMLFLFISKTYIINNAWAKKGFETHPENSLGLKEQSPEIGVNQLPYQPL